MTRLAWVTDPHLNFLTLPQVVGFCTSINKKNVDYVVITGDISEADKLETHLFVFKKYCKAPIYFVAGNHDYYRGSIASTRKMLSEKFGKQNKNCIWLNEAGVVTLKEGVALVGHDGWYDGEYSSFKRSVLVMNDHHLISEIRYDAMFNPSFPSCKKLAQECADHIKKHLTEAFKHHDEVFFATHVAPFKENSRAPDGTISDKNWMPWFSSKLAGDAILEVMNNLPSSADLTVICGHNHTPFIHKPKPNITCITGAAKYGSPKIYKIFEI